MNPASTGQLNLADTSASNAPNLPTTPHCAYPHSSGHEQQRSRKRDGMKWRICAPHLSSALDPLHLDHLTAFKPQRALHSKLLGVRDVGEEGVGEDMADGKTDLAGV